MGYMCVACRKYEIISEEDGSLYCLNCGTHYDDGAELRRLKKEMIKNRIW